MPPCTFQAVICGADSPLKMPRTFESFESETLTTPTTNNPVGLCLMAAEPAHSSKSRLNPAAPPAPLPKRSSVHPSQAIPAATCHVSAEEGPEPPPQGENVFLKRIAALCRSSSK